MDKSADAYRTISEAAAEVNLPTHVLRFWESKFTQLKPVKHKGGRRLYRPQDILLLKGLRRLLYEEGYTIKGVQKYLRDHGVSTVAELGAGGEPQALEPQPEITSKASAPVAGEADEAGDLFAPAKARSAASDPGLATRLKTALARVEKARDRLDAALAARG